MSPTSSLIEQARARKAAQQKAGTGTLPKILFVDDEERILHALHSLFRMRYDVTVTTSARQALTLLRQHHYHLIVSDQRMPEIEGIEVLRQAREISPATVRILLTGFADLAAIIGSVNDGEVFRYLNKPWNREDLEATISRAVKIGMDLKAAVPAAAPIGAGYGESEVSPNQHSVLCIEKSHQIYELIRANPMSGAEPLDAATLHDGIDIMHEREVSVVIVEIDGDRSIENFGFLNLLKKEFPHVVAIAVCERADASTTVNLINNARIFRLLFRPIRLGALRLYLSSALRQADSYVSCPTLVETQQTADIPDEETASAITKLSSSIGARLGMIKSFFSRAVHSRA